MGPGAQVGLSPSTNAEAHRTAGVPPFHLVHDGRRSISARISDRRHQRILRLPGVQACMLDHHRDIGLENAGITLSQGIGSGSVRLLKRKCLVRRAATVI
jgi:hypothetical protein